MSIYINLLFEDSLSEAVLHRLLMQFGNKYIVSYSYGNSGFGFIKKNINGFNQACKIVPFLVLTDLDNNKCPMTIINSWFSSKPHENMIFRIAIREVEAWLLADIEGLSDYTGVSEANFPDKPELEPDPKRTLINIAQKSKRREIRESIVPKNEFARIGPDYNGKLIEFVMYHWSIERAQNRSNSLKRACKRLESFVYSVP